MNRRDFVDACRSIALSRGHRRAFSKATYSDSTLTIECSETGVSITVREAYAVKSKVLITSINGQIRFYRGWQKYTEHVARLTILDQLAKVHDGEPFTQGSRV
jgi:hypothetical protein